METLVIGIDGATFTVLDSLFQADYLPNLKKAISRGSYGFLESTLPPVTALAWPSFFTGLNPGNHGLLGWRLPMINDFSRPLVNSQLIQGEKLWDVIGNSGLSIYCVNIPVTYPPEPINGGMISGMLTPSLDSDFTFPPTLKTELRNNFPDYQIDTDISRVEPNLENLPLISGVIKKAQQITHTRSKTIQWIIKEKKPDVIIAVFEIIDRLQHILWPYIASLPGILDSRKSSQNIQLKLLESFKLLDDEIGSLISLLPPKGKLLILSDHGFGPMSSVIRLNSWLEKFGWLKYKVENVPIWDSARKVISSFKRKIPNKMLNFVRETLPIYKTIQWENSKAYSGSITEQGIFINLKGREPAGLVEPRNYEQLRSEIIETLEMWNDPNTGKKPFKKVFRREDVYQGLYTSLAPDIIFELLPGFTISNQDVKSRKGSALVEVIQDSPWGWHERKGIFALSGPEFIHQRVIHNAEIIDIMPTLLYLMGLKVPRGLDGVVLKDAFLKSHIKKNPPKYQNYQSSKRQSGTVSEYSFDEIVQIQERLKKLGYL